MRKLLLSALLTALTVIGVAGTATAQVSIRSVGTVPGIPAGARAVGALPAAAPISVTLALEPRSRAALSAFATEVATPGSAAYRRYLTVRQFSARFGASAAELKAVRSAVTRAGLTGGRLTANRLALTLSGPARAFAALFHTGFARYRLSSGDTVYANTEVPRLSGALARAVQGVFGLSDVPAERPLALLKSRALLRLVDRTTRGRLRRQAVPAGAASACTTASSAASSYGGWTTDQLASAYDEDALYGAGDLGQGVTVALYELEGNIPSDITAFEQCYGIGDGSNVSYKEVDGGQTSPSDTDAQAEEEGLETELDIENVVGLAPGVKAVVYQAPNTDAGAMDNYEQIVSDDTAKVISTSWGDCESAEGQSGAQSEETVFEEAAAQGQSMVAAAGDDGSEDCWDASAGDGSVSTGLPGPNPGLAVDDPGSDPYVTSAGGTTLTAIGNAPATRPTETVWNDGAVFDLADQGGAGGGGNSSFWTMPTYQSGAAHSLDVINSESSAGTNCGGTSAQYCREVPDVTASADPDYPYIVYWAGSWTAVGGTSGAAPLWASIYALTDGDPGCQSHSLGFANPALYDAAGNAFGTYFNDITNGNNDAFDTNGGAFAAMKGFDDASGLGSPVAGALAPELCTVS